MKERASRSSWVLSKLWVAHGDEGGPMSKEYDGRQYCTAVRQCQSAPSAQRDCADDSRGQAWAGCAWTTARSRWACCLFDVSLPIAVVRGFRRGGGSLTATSSTRIQYADSMPHLHDLRGTSLRRKPQNALKYSTGMAAGCDVRVSAAGRRSSACGLFAVGDDCEVGDLGEWDGGRIVVACHGQPDFPVVS